MKVAFFFFPQKTPSILFNNCWYAQCVYIIQTHMAKHTSKSIGNRCSMKSLHMVEVLNTVPLPIFQFAWYAFAGGRNEFKFVYIWLNTLYHLMNVVFLSRKCWRTISSSFFYYFQSHLRYSNVLTDEAQYDNSKSNLSRQFY